MAATGLIALVTCLLTTAAAAADNYKTFTDAGRDLSATVGIVERSATPVRIGVPSMFLIGLDNASLQWARNNSAHFRTTGAMGYMIDPINDATLAKIRRYTNIDRVFRLPNAQTLFDVLGISHYPVFIDYANGVITQ